jgi:hypothetical protein
MTTLRDADTNTVTGAARDEKLLAAIGKYNQELLRAVTLAVVPGPQSSQQALDAAAGRGATVSRLYFL